MVEGKWSGMSNSSSLVWVFLWNLLIIPLQDPNEDTEWNDVLRAKGIIPPKEKKEEITEDDIVNMLEQTIEKK